MLLSPFSKLVVSPYSTQITTSSVLSPIGPLSTVFSPAYPLAQTYNMPFLSPINTIIDFDPGLNDSYPAQKDMTRELLNRILDKWLYTDEMCHLLKYLKVSGTKVDHIQYEKDVRDNKICNDTVEDVERKADWIEENLLNMHEMRKILTRITGELGVKWYNLLLKPNEALVVDAVERYLNKKLKDRL